MPDPQRPAFTFIALDAAGRPRLVALRCRSCGATYAESERLACAACGARTDALERFHPALEGTLHSAVIVHRSYPGAQTPFISAIVDLDGGPALKGTLRGTAGLTPTAIRPGQRVQVCFDDALGRTDKDGNGYIAHYFTPLGGLEIRP